MKTKLLKILKSQTRISMTLHMPKSVALIALLFQMFPNPNKLKKLFIIILTFSCDKLLVPNTRIYKYSSESQL